MITLDSIADAIVYAAAYISCRDESAESCEDDDSAISHIMAYLSHVTTEEEHALAAAARRALREEGSLDNPNQEMIDFFENWMEIMVGGDWDGNQRA